MPQYHIFSIREATQCPCLVNHYLQTSVTFVTLFKQKLFNFKQSKNHIHFNYSYQQLLLSNIKVKVGKSIGQE